MIEPVTDSLEVIAPRVLQVAFRGEQLEVGPLTIDQLPLLIRKARPLVEAVLDMDVSADSELLGLVMELIENQAGPLTEAIAIAVGRERAFIGAGTLDEFTRLSLAVFEVNQDFFLKTLAPRLVRAWAASKAAPGAGPTVSRRSSSGGTRSRKSKNTP